MDEVERVVVIPCSRTTEFKFVNKGRQKLFAGGRQIENIPITQDDPTYEKGNISKNIHLE